MQLVSGIKEGLSSDLYEQLSQYRHKVFIEMLGWELPSSKGSEIDQFDRPDTVYVVAKDKNNCINGCARLLPTTRPYLLGEVFPELLNGATPPSSPDIWELSRFAAIDLNGNRRSIRGQFSSDTAVELLKASISCAASHGAKRLIAVTPTGVERLLRSASFHVHRAGPPKVVDGYPLFACWIEISS